MVIKLTNIFDCSIRVFYSNRCKSEVKQYSITSKECPVLNILRHFLLFVADLALCSHPVLFHFPRILLTQV